MEISIPHAVTYDVPGPVPVDDIIESLRGTQSSAKEIETILESCLPGLTVDDIRVSVRSISQESPLREVFFISLFLTFKEDLEHEVPRMIEQWTNTPISEDYDTLITVCVMVLIFYGADYLYSKFKEKGNNSNINKQLDKLISDLALEMGCSEAYIRDVLKQKYEGQRLRKIAKAASRFFKPSKRQGNAGIKIGNREIKRATVAEVPGDISDDALEPQETSKQYANVEVELHAQDRDYAKRGWAAVVPSVSDKRMRMHIFPPTKPEELWTRQKVTGDVVIVFKNHDGEYTPIECHLLRLTD